MGAWGIGSFENDGAGMLLADLLHGDDLAPLDAAFDEVLTNDDYIEVYEAQAAVGAGEVVALLIGSPGESLPDRLRAWCESHPRPIAPDLIRRAFDAVGKVFAGSEMRELWEETEDFDDWRAVIDDLLGRLQAGLEETRSG